MKRWKRFRALLAIILVVVMLVQMSVVAFAENGDQAEPVITEPVVTEPIVENESERETQIIAELTDERQEYEKRFMLSNGSMMAVQYDLPVHFLDDDGNWIQYDNRMQETSEILDTETEKSSSTEYRVIESDSDVRLSKKAGNKKIVTIAKDGHQISWGFVGVNKVELELTDVEETAEGNDKFLNLQGIVQEGWYREAFEDADLQYLILPTGVKENIILKSADAPTEFEMEYKFKKLTAVQIDSKTIDLQDSEGNVVYTITAPNMQDANGAWSDALSLSITEQKNNKLRIKLTIDEDWINSTDRAFPITVDPSFETEREWGIADSTTIVSGHPDTSYGYGGTYYIGTLYVGYGPESGFNKTRSLLKLNNLPELSPGDVVVDAKLCATQYVSSMSIQVNAHKVNSEWEGTTATWNNMHSNYETEILDYDTTTYGEVETTNSWNITSLAREWYDGTSENYGIMLISPSETSTSSARVGYFSSKYPDDSTVRPFFEITYRNNKGLEDYWTYHQQSLSSGATGYINDFSGNLVFQIPLLCGDGSEISNVTLTYNSFSSNKQYMDKMGGGMGNGWKTNWNQSCYSVTQIPEVSDDIVGGLQEAGYTYAYIDSDDTIHYFRTTNADGMLEDEDNLGMLMYVKSDMADYYVIDGADGSKMYFTYLGFLQESIDYNYNEAVITYDTLKVDEIAINDQAVTKFIYDTGNMLTTVMDADGNETRLEYDLNGNLTKVIYPDNTEINLEYTVVLLNDESFSLLSRITDETGKYLSYSYNVDGSVNKRTGISSAKEYDSLGEVVSTLDISTFSNNTTLFSYENASDKNELIYEFDNYGKTISVSNYDRTIFKHIEHKILNNEIIFTVTTVSGSYNRLKVGNEATGVTLAVSDTYTIDEDGNYVWTVKTNEPMIDTNYVFDLRKTNNGYLGENYQYAVIGIKNICHRVIDGKIIFNIKTVPGDYSKISLSYYDDIDTVVAESNVYTVDSNGNYIWEIKLDPKDRKTEYCFNLHDEDNESLQNNYFYDVSAVTGIKAVTHKASNGKIVFNIVTDPGDYNRIKITTADNLSESLSVTDSYTVNSKGNYVWTIEMDAPTTDMEYGFDVRTTDNKYLKDYYFYEVTDIVGVKDISYEIIEDKIVFNITTDAGLYNRTKVTSSDNLLGSIAVSNTYEVDSNGDYVWTIRADAPTTNTSYAFDLRRSDTGKYIHDYYHVDVSVSDEAYQFVIFGAYNDGESKIEISWLSDYDISWLLEYEPEYCYRLFESSDNVEYMCLGTVDNASSYSYDITQDFETKYLKMSFVNDGGRIMNSVPLKVTKNGETYDVDFLDTDEDEVYDVIEISYGTNINVSDTDGDGLSDYQEIFVTGTDPLNYSSVTENVPDAQADGDQDGLSTIQELSFGTDAQKADTDEDGLNDYDEVNVHNTDPLNADTDNDGMSDKCEIQYNTNPVLSDTDGDGVKDGEQKFDVPLDGTISENANYKITPSLNVTLSGSQVDSLSIKKVEDDELLFNSSIPGYLGEAYDLTVDGEFDRATLSFEVDRKSLDEENFTPRIYYWNEENQVLTEVPNQTVDGNVISAELEHFSKYVVLNKDIFDGQWKEYGILAPVDENLKNNKLNVALLLDESGSISKTDFNTMKDVSVYMLKKLSLEDKVALFSFNSNVSIKSSFSNKEHISEQISRIDKQGGGTAIYTALKRACYEFDNVDSTDATNIIILLTDGQNGDNTHKDAVDKAVERGVIIHTVGIGSGVNEKELTNIANKTGGCYYSVENYGALADALTSLIIDTDVYRDTDKDGLSDYHEKKLASGEIKFGMGDVKLTLLGLGVLTYNFKGLSHLKADSDNDGLLDGEELSIREVNISGEPTYYCFVTSNPVKINSDGDGLDDLLDNAPLDRTKHSFLIYETRKTDRYLKSYTNENAPNGYPVDMLYGKLTKAQLLEIGNINQSDFQPTADFWNSSNLESDLRRKMKSLFSIASIADFGLFDVGDRIVDRFFSGTGRDFYDDELSEKAANHESTQKYVAEISKILNNLIAEENGKIILAKYDAEEARDEEIRDKMYIVDKMTDEEGNVTVPQPNFDDWLDSVNGLGICVHDLYGNRIEITSYKFDGVKYTYTLKFTYFDIFGLEPNDITEAEIAPHLKFGYLQEFRAWYILQHYDLYYGKYKPFITYMEFEKQFEYTII